MPLTDAMRKELAALAALPDSEIDYCDIPEQTDLQVQDFTTGPWTPLQPHTVTLWLDDEVGDWLTNGGAKHIHSINRSLKRLAQQIERSRKTLDTGDASDLSEAS